jgi:hypothetical protein
MEAEQIKALMEGEVLSVVEMHSYIYIIGLFISLSLSEFSNNYDKEGSLKWLDH